MKLTNRQQSILFAIIEEYIQNYEPVSSKELAKKYFQNISSATIRAEMAYLEKQGFLVSPHTSAGRIPSVSAYQLYVDTIDFTGTLTKELEKELREVLYISEDNKNVRILAKKIAEILDACIIIVFSKYDHYYTGVSHLLTKPDFANPHLLYNISEIIDQLDQILPTMHERIGDTIDIYIGEENPLSKLCSVMTTDLKGMKVLILNPIRTNYKLQYQLLTHIKQYVGK